MLVLLLVDEELELLEDGSTQTNWASGGTSSSAASPGSGAVCRSAVDEGLAAEVDVLDVDVC